MSNDELKANYEAAMRVVQNYTSPGNESDIRRYVASLEERAGADQSQHVITQRLTALERKVRAFNSDPSALGKRHDELGRYVADMNRHLRSLIESQDKRLDDQNAYWKREAETVQRRLDTLEGANRAEKKSTGMQETCPDCGSGILVGKPGELGKCWGCGRHSNFRIPTASKGGKG
jgi:predicted RNase H-like nuclease (RuvC/YqgF family)